MTLTLNKRQKPVIVNQVGQRAVFRLDEAVAVCPKCKAVQTVCFFENRLMQTRKFSQKGSQIFHDCGSTAPCRLYRGI